MTTPEGMTIARTLLDRSPVDWAGQGFSTRDLDGLVEVMVRMLQSMVVDPPHPPRDAAALRRFLRRWVAPAVASTSVPS
jgi:hypothetical protein